MKSGIARWKIAVSADRPNKYDFLSMSSKLGPEQTNESDSSDGSVTPRFVVTNDRATVMSFDASDSTPSTLASLNNLRDGETLVTRDACKRYE